METSEPKNSIAGVLIQNIISFFFFKADDEIWKYGQPITVVLNSKVIFCFCLCL